MKMSFEPTYRPPLEIPSLERASALVCWPVEWVEGDKPEKENLHVTAAYIPDVVASKEEILGILRGPVLGRRIKKGYHLAKVMGPAAFGELENVPVLLVNAKVGNGVYPQITDIASTIRDNLVNQGVDTTFRVNPHVTVDLPTLLRPPTQVLLRPLELWYREDEPVVI